MPTQSNPFDPAFEDLPDQLRIFPLSRALLLPRQELPLNIFEPRYLQMVIDSLGSGRYIGMVQPRAEAEDQAPVPVYRVGCAGRITTFQEAADGRLLIQLTGVCRYEIETEFASDTPYRIVQPNWKPFADDLSPQTEAPIGFEDLEPRLKRYAAAQQLQVQWQALKKLPSADLVNFLAIHLPFEVAEKQALIEAKDVVARADILCKAIDMGGQSGNESTVTRH